MSRILIAEDKPNIVWFLAKGLRAKGHVTKAQPPRLTEGFPVDDFLVPPERRILPLQTTIGPKTVASGATGHWPNHGTPPGPLPLRHDFPLRLHPRRGPRRG